MGRFLAITVAAAPTTRPSGIVDHLWRASFLPAAALPPPRRAVPRRGGTNCWCDGQTDAQRRPRSPRTRCACSAGFARRSRTTVPRLRRSPLRGRIRQPRDSGAPARGSVARAAREARRRAYLGPCARPRAARLRSDRAQSTRRSRGCDDAVEWAPDQRPGASLVRARFIVGSSRPRRGHRPSHPSPSAAGVVRDTGRTPRSRRPTGAVTPAP